MRTSCSSSIMASLILILIRSSEASDSDRACRMVRASGGEHCAFVRTMEERFTGMKKGFSRFQFSGDDAVK